MLAHTNNYDKAIRTFGRQIKTVITYGTTTLEDELKSVKLNTYSDLLKSVMKELVITSLVDIPLNTEINLKNGVLTTENDYEFIDYGKFIVYSSEKQEDKVYQITCYDKMLYSMVDYKPVNLQFPTTLRSFLTAISNDLKLTFKNNTDNFPNHSRIVNQDVFKGLSYTYRDVLDQFAQATGSNIIVNKYGELELKYVTDTDTIIDEDILKDKNVAIKEKFGPINSIVLSRSVGSDNVYLKDDKSVEANGLCELKIEDNQLMNFNDRSDYLPDILEKLNGLEFYKTDYEHFGLGYLEVLDKYVTKIDDKEYSCLLLNDEFNISGGINEHIYTDEIETSITDYSKADKTDRKINQTVLMVDKQNQIIESVISEQEEDRKRIVQLTQSLDSIESLISGDFGMIKETKGINSAYIENSADYDLIDIKIDGYVSNTKMIYPSLSKYPRSNTYPDSYEFKNLDKITLCLDVKNSNTPTGKLKEYEININSSLLSKGNIKDTLYLELNGSKLKGTITRRLKYKDGIIVELNEPVIESIEIDSIILYEGENYLYIKENTNYDIFLHYMYNSDMNKYYATKVELNSSIKQTEDSIMSTVSGTYTTKKETEDGKKEIKQEISTINQKADEITLEVSKKVGEDEVVSTINQSAEEISLKGNRFVLESTNCSIDKNGNLKCNNAELQGKVKSQSGEIGGWKLTEKGLSNGTYFFKNNGYTNIYTFSDIVILQKHLSGSSKIEDDLALERYDLNGDGKVDIFDLVLLRKKILEGED